SVGLSSAPTGRSSDLSCAPGWALAVNVTSPVLRATPKEEIPPGLEATWRASPPSAGNNHSAVSGLWSGAASGSVRAEPNRSEPSGRNSVLLSLLVERVKRRGDRPPSDSGTVSISHTALRNDFPSGDRPLTGATRRLP